MKFAIVANGNNYLVDVSKSIIRVTTNKIEVEYPAFELVATSLNDRLSYYRIYGTNEWIGLNMHVAPYVSDNVLAAIKKHWNENEGIFQNLAKQLGLV